MLSRIWRTALAVAGLLTVLSIGVPAQAAPARCISDAELEAEVGAQVRAGAFAVDTRRLSGRPMCSGLTIAQAIQQLHDRHFPADATPAAVAADPPRDDRSYTAAPPSAAAIRPDLAVLERYIDQPAYPPVGGKPFLQQPAVISGLTRAGVDPVQRRVLDRHDVRSAVSREGSILSDGGCVPHSCDTNHYRLFIDLRTGVTALCLFDFGRALWYAPSTGGRPLVIPRDCPESAASGDTPGPVRAALGAGSNGVADYGSYQYGRGSPAEPDGPAGGDRTLPRGDLTRFLRFEDAAYCSSAAHIAILHEADEKGWASIGPLGRVDFDRSRDGEFVLLVGRVDATWNGLRIAQFTYHYIPESDSLSRAIVFADPPAKVGPVMRRLGFGLSQGERTAGGNDAMEISISVQPNRNGGTTLECAQ